MLKTRTTNYEKLAADEIADFCEQFETSEARKKASNKHSQKSNDTSHSSRYKKRKVSHANYSQQSSKCLKHGNDNGKNNENRKKWCCTCTKAERKLGVVALHNKDKCKFNKRYNNGK